MTSTPDNPHWRGKTEMGSATTENACLFFIAMSSPYTGFSKTFFTFAPGDKTNFLPFLYF
jgi:hypothetical protein